MKNKKLYVETPENFYKRTYWDLPNNRVLVFKSEIELHTIGCLPEEFLTIHEAKIRLQTLQNELNWSKSD